MLLPLYILFAILFLVQQARYPQFRFSFLLKIVPIALLVLLAATELSAPIRTIVVCALVLSACGDVALALERENSFLVGLGFFLTAHIAYIVALLSSRAVTSAALIPILIVLAVALLLARRLLPHLGSLRVPVLIYIAIIAAMGIAAALFAPFTPLLVIGALVFMVSDATIAIHRFLHAVPLRDFIVMSTYYAAQLLITLGFMAALPIN